MTALEAQAGLAEDLAAAVAPLDYRFLNELIATPTDENLARHLAAEMPGSPVQRIGIASTSDQGAEVAGERVRVWRRFRFRASHNLAEAPSDHHSARVHAHAFAVVVHCAQDLRRGADLGVDYEVIARAWRDVEAELADRVLNDIPGLAQPSSEVVCRWIYRRLSLAGLPHLAWVTVYETDTCGCHFDGAGFRIWVDQPFEAALSPTSAAMVGGPPVYCWHTYLARLHLSPPFDEARCWTVDYGAVRQAFTPLAVELEERGAHAIDELAGDTVGLLGWIRGRLAASFPDLDRIELYERPGDGVQARWGGEPPELPL